MEKTKWILYEGTFEFDKRKGYGEVKWSNGSEYKGYFDNNERHGQGEMRWYDGTLYVGEWKNGLQSGWGTLKVGNEIKTGYYQNNTYMGTNGPLTNSQSTKTLLPSLANGSGY